MNSGRGRTASARKSSDPLADWARTIHRTNVTGLGTRRDYELVFASLACEQREAFCASVPFLVGLRNNGVSIGDLGALGAYAPDEQLPQELRDRLAVMNEVVEASGTQIVEIRQNGGERSEEYSVEGRMNAGTLMVAFGDTDASLLRQTAWARDGKGGWKFSAVTEDAATRHGLSREDLSGWQMIWAARCRRWTRRRSFEPAPSTRKLIALPRGAGSATRACRACSAGTDVGASDPVKSGHPGPANSFRTGD